MRAVRVLLVGSLLAMSWGTGAQENPATAEAASSAPVEPATSAATPAPEPPPPPKALTPIDQVQIQVWISQTDEDGLRELGANLNYTRFVREIEQSGSVERVGTRTFNPNAFDVQLPAPDANPYPDNVRLTPESRNPWRPAGNTLTQIAPAPGTADAPVDVINTVSGVGLTGQVIDAGRGTLEGIFRGIETKRDVDLISKPELLVINGQKAAIHAGEQVPYQSIEYKNGRPVLGILWKDVGVNMELTPTVLPNRMVQLNFSKLDVTDRLSSQPIQSLEVPVFSQRSQTGGFIVPDGQTLVIGGLVTRNVTKTERRVPIVGKIPILGMPFRHRNASAQNSHLLIFVSPTVVDLRNMTEETTNAIQFWREEKWKHMDDIDEEIKQLEMDL